MKNNTSMTAHFHLPGLFEFYEFYKLFLPLFREKREYFFEWCDIASVYGAPADCIWGGGRAGYGDDDPGEVFALMREYGISCRLTFSNSLLREEHLSDARCNRLCRELEESGAAGDAGDACASDEHYRSAGVIVHSELLLNYLSEKYPQLYFISSTTKVLTKFSDLKVELGREEFSYVVPDFRLNKAFDELSALPDEMKQKVEFLCNECCDFGCAKRKQCYENVSRICLGEDDRWDGADEQNRSEARKAPYTDFECASPYASEGYVFSRAMENPGFISADDIRDIYLPMGFSNFKIEGRSLGSALLLEFILYYMTKPEHRLHVREKIYLNHSLDIV